MVVSIASIKCSRSSGRAASIFGAAALFASQNVVTWAENFTKDNNKQLMVILTFGRGNVAKYLAGQPRFDQSFVDWLKGKPFPVIDMLEVFARDYERYKVNIES